MLASSSLLQQVFQNLKEKICWGKLCNPDASGRRARAISSTETDVDLENACNNAAKDL
jgi:hypothetical protein